MKSNDLFSKALTDEIKKLSQEIEESNQRLAALKSFQQSGGVHIKKKSATKAIARKSGGLRNSPVRDSVIEFFNKHKNAPASISEIVKAINKDREKPIKSAGIHQIIHKNAGFFEKSGDRAYRLVEKTDEQTAQPKPAKTTSKTIHKKDKVAVKKEDMSLRDRAEIIFKESADKTLTAEDLLSRMIIQWPVIEKVKKKSVLNMLRKAPKIFKAQPAGKFSYLGG